MIKRKPTATSQNQGGSVLLDTTRSQPLTSYDSRSYSVLVQEMLALQDLDEDRDLLFTNSLLRTMSTLKTSSYINPQEKVFSRYQKELNRAKGAVFELAEAGDTEGICELLKRFPLSLDIRSFDGRQNTLMHIAAKIGCKRMIDFLVKDRSVEVMNLRNSSGWTAVTVMIANQPSLLRHVLQYYSNRVNWNYRDDNGNGYLHYAYFYELDEQLIEELSWRCDPNYENIFKLRPKYASGYNTPTKDPTSKLRRQYTIDITSPAKTHQPEQALEDMNKRCSSSSPTHKRGSLRAFKNAESPPQTPIKNYVMRSINSLSYKLDDFRLERLLGGGAFADAYEVTHIKSGRVLALKCIHKNRMSHESLKYAYNEKELLAKLQHPNLIKFYCCFQNKGYLFLILELCPNGTLRDLLKRPTQLPESYIRLLVAELVEVLGFLHDNCVIYRDLKPENIGIDSEGHLKLLDLGLSKEARRSNSICGSYHYLAPEMVSGGEHSFGLDWYMLGITIYELVTGTTPFKGKTPSELLKRISEYELPTVPFASPYLQDFITKLVHKQPEKRLGWKNDATEIKQHPWLSPINWNRLARRQYNMSAEYFFSSKPRQEERPVLYPSQPSSLEFEDLYGWELIVDPLM